MFTSSVKAVLSTLMTAYGGVDPSLLLRECEALVDRVESELSP